jgi:membrane protein DedA with SNARE-associated domain
MFDWITAIITRIGETGIALLMFLENVLPPIPSEVIMPLAGFIASRGQMALAAVILAGTIGSLAGAVLWYWIGRKLGRRRMKRLTRRTGRWLAVSPQDVDRAEDWFARYGGLAVLVGRLVPTVRTFISVPAGITAMPFGRFLVYTLVGTALWTALLAAAGFVLAAQYHRIADWLDPVSAAVLGTLALWYLWRVTTFRPGPAHPDR